MKKYEKNGERNPFHSKSLTEQLGLGIIVFIPRQIG